MARGERGEGCLLLGVRSWAACRRAWRQQSQQPRRAAVPGPGPHLACSVDAQVQRVAAAGGECKAHIIRIDLMQGVRGAGGRDGWEGGRRAERLALAGPLQRRRRLSPPVAAAHASSVTLPSATRLQEGLVCARVLPAQGVEEGGREQRGRLHLRQWEGSGRHSGQAVGRLLPCRSGLAMCEHHHAEETTAP